MATKLYFHAAASGVAGTLPSTEQSTLTLAANADAVTVNRSMNTTIGTSQATLNIAATNSTRNLYYTKFVSEPIYQTTVAANTWTYAFTAMESSTSINFPVSANNKSVHVHCYVWRPSNGTKVGTIIDGASAATVDEGTANAQLYHIVSFTGAEVTGLADGDVIVFEVWFVIASTTTGSQTFYYDGTTEYAENGTSTSAASYISTPENLVFTAPPTRVTQTTIVKYNIVGRTVQTTILKYNIVGRILQSTILKYNLLSRIAQSTILKYSIIQRVIQSAILKYDIIGRVLQSSIIKYNITQLVSQSLILKYNILQRASQNFVTKYNILGRITQSTIFKYNIVSRTTNTLITKYNIIGRIVNAININYDIFTNEVLTRVENSVIFKYNIIGRVSNPITLRYGIIERIFKGLTLNYNIIERVFGPISIKYDVLERILKPIILKYNILEHVSKQINLSYSIVGRIRGSIEILYNIISLIGQPVVETESAYGRRMRDRHSWRSSISRFLRSTSKTDFMI